MYNIRGLLQGGVQTDQVLDKSQQTRKSKGHLKFVPIVGKTSVGSEEQMKKKMLSLLRGLFKLHYVPPYNLI